MGKDGIHPNPSSAKIEDTIKLLNIELDRRHLQVGLALIPIIMNSGGAPTTESTGVAQRKLNHRIY